MDNTLPADDQAALDDYNYALISLAEIVVAQRRLGHSDPTVRQVINDRLRQAIEADTGAPASDELREAFEQLIDAAFVFAGPP